MTLSVNNNDRVHAPLEKATRSITEPFLDFAAAQSASGWVLLAATFLAICFANSPWRDAYLALLHFDLGFSFNGNEFAMSLQHWVNDGLMAVFFFLLGLELKRELLVGKLSDIKSATSVLCAAVGGMALPAAVFLAFAHTPDVLTGWAIPVATDTAFALMILVLLGDRVPAAARAFLVGLAIVDDLGAILVIALAYTQSFELAWAYPAAAVAATLLALNLTGVRSGFMYFLAGVALWIVLLQLGLHGTLAGVIVALAAPVRPAIARPAFTRRLKQTAGEIEDEHNGATDSIFEQPEQHAIAHEVIDVAKQATAPLSRWEHKLEKPISFAVMPLFAFMNAGIVVSGDAFQTAWSNDLSTAIFAALLIGKPLGILAGVWLGQLLGWTDMPEHLTLRHIFGIGLLGAIGFTMSLFIATLSFGEGSVLLEIAKQSVIAASLSAGIFGYIWLRWCCKWRAR